MRSLLANAKSNLCTKTSDADYDFRDSYQVASDKKLDLQLMNIPYSIREVFRLLVREDLYRSSLICTVPKQCISNLILASNELVI